MKFHAHTETTYIRVDTRLCEACWTCVDTCPNGVLGKIDLKFHRHVHVDAAESCTGCLKCVRACPHGAISRIARKKPVRIEIS